MLLLLLGFLTLARSLSPRKKKKKKEVKGGGGGGRLIEKSMSMTHGFFFLFFFLHFCCAKQIIFSSGRTPHFIPFFLFSSLSLSPFFFFFFFFFSRLGDQMVFGTELALSACPVGFLALSFYVAHTWLIIGDVYAVRIWVNVAMLGQKWSDLVRNLAHGKRFVE